MERLGLDRMEVAFTTTCAYQH